MPRARTSSTAGPRSTRPRRRARQPVRRAGCEAAPAAEATEVAAPDRDDLTAAPMPLADHVSDSMEHAPGELTVPPGYSVLEGIPTGERRAVGIVVARFNGDVTTRLLESALAELDARGVPARQRHGDAGARRVRASARRDGPRQDAPLRLHRRARLRDPRRHAALRLRLERGRQRPPARRDRDRRARRVRRAHARPGRPGREPRRQGRRGGAHRPRDGRPVREPARRRVRR